MVKHQAFDDLFFGPVFEYGGDGADGLENNRVRFRPFDRPADPPATARSGMQCVFAVQVVDQRADAACQAKPFFRQRDGVDQQFFQMRQPLF